MSIISSVVNNLIPATTNKRAETTQELFEKLSLQNVIVQYCYALWDAKEITLEQSLELAVKKLADACYRVMQLIPANLLVTFGRHFDCIESVNQMRIRPIEKAEFLVEYLSNLIELAATHPMCQPSIRVIVSSDDFCLLAVAPL